MKQCYNIRIQGDIMSENQLIKSKNSLVISSVALLFCLVWALIGESDIKIIAVTVAFVCFLKAGIETEMAARAEHGSH